MAERKKLGDLLLEAGVIDRQQLNTALSHQKRWGGRVGEILVTLNFVSEDRLLKTLSMMTNLPSVDVTKTKASSEAIKLVPIEMSKKLNVLPLGVKYESGKKVLFLAMSDPTNLPAIDEVQFHTGLTVKPVVASDSGISEAIRFYYDGIGFGESSSLTSRDPTMMKVEQPHESIGNAARVLTALIEVLQDKGIITKDEMNEKLNRLYSRK